MNHYLAIDIGGTFIKYGLVDHSGNIKECNKVKTPDQWEPFLDQLIELVEENILLIKGVGISCPGKIDTQTGTISFGGSLPFLHGKMIKQILENRFTIPCSIINDGKAAALAELWLGELRDVRNGAAIVLGTGIGGGLILNGELFEGSNFLAGELSLLLRSPDEIETEALMGMTGSAVGLVRKSAKLLGIADETDGIAVFEELKTNVHSTVYNLFSDYCREIAAIIFNLQATLDLETVVIGGGISIQPVVVEEIRRQYLEMRLAIPVYDAMFDELKITPCYFRNEANLLGAIFNLILQKEKLLLTKAYS